MKQAKCSRCDKPRDRKGQRYCSSCHARYMIERRAQDRLLLIADIEDATHALARIKRKIMGIKNTSG